MYSEAARAMDANDRTLRPNIMDLDDMAKALVQRLCVDFACANPKTSVSESVYSTAWVSMLPSPSKSSGHWLFPQAFDFICEQQLENGSWASLEASAGDPSWHVDNILSTMAALLALCVRADSGIEVPNNIEESIRRGDGSLRLVLQSWDINSSDDIGFEVLIPAHLKMLEKYNMVYQFPAQPGLERLYEQKIRKMTPESLYGEEPSTLLHSLESMIGHIDFNRVAHHKLFGSMLCSPSSTAAYLMSISRWDTEAETYLHNSMPSKGSVEVYPTNLFEIIWPLRALLRGFGKQAIWSYELDRIADFLEDAFWTHGGLAGCTPGAVDDSDDTSSLIYVLTCLGRNVKPHAMISRYESSDKFRCYTVERTPSLSANAHVLQSLLNLPNPSQYMSQIIKTSTYLADRWWRGEINDKWNMTPHYSMMLISQSMTMLLHHWGRGLLPDFPVQLIKEKLLAVLFGIAVETLQIQHDDGSWGLHSRETTAYAILCLAAMAPVPLCDVIKQQVELAISHGRSFLLTRVEDWTKPDIVWRSRTAYGLGVVSEAYTLVAMKIELYDRSFGQHVEDICNIARPSLSSVEQISRLPLFAEMPEWLRGACVVEGYLQLPLLDIARREASVHIVKSHTHLDILPFEMMACSRSPGAFITPGTNFAFTVFCALLFDFDHYVEDIIAGLPNGDIHQVEKIVRGIFDEPSIDFPDNYTTSGPESDLDNVKVSLLRLTAWTVNHPNVISSSKHDQTNLRRNIKTYYLAQIESIRQNAALAGSRRAQQAAIFPDQSYHTWVHTTAASHVALPLVFAFFTCLIHPGSDGHDCFPTAEAKYLAHALCMHAAAQSRMENDIGSVARDRKENNLNSVDCPEFTDTCLAAAASGQNGDAAAAAAQGKIQQLRRLAAYERECAEKAFTKLSAMTGLKADVVRGVRFIRNTVDMYGQMYARRDFSPGLEVRG